VDEQKAATPEIVRQIYENVDKASALRELCALFIRGYLTRKNWCPLDKDDYQPLFEKYPQLGWSLFNNNLEDRVDKSSKENHCAREKEDGDCADRLNWMKFMEAAEEALEKEENDDAEIIPAQKKVGKGGAREEA
jgi:hypothetical protein